MVRTIETTPSATVDLTAYAKTLLSNVNEVNGIKFLAIPLFMLEPHPDIQRPIKAHARRIAANYDPKKAKAIIVSYRDGHFWILDGQHRYLAARDHGEDYMACQVYENLTIEEEALLFGLQDENTIRLTPREKTKAMVIAKDPLAVSLMDICNEYGIGVYNSEGKPLLRSVRAAESALRTTGSDGLRWIFDVIQGAGWHTEGTAYGDTLIGSLRYIYMRHENERDWTKATLIRALRSSSFAHVKAMAKASYREKTTYAALQLFLEEGINRAKSALPSRESN